jgi:hypothetical protein
MAALPAALVAAALALAAALRQAQRRHAATQRGRVQPGGLCLRGAELHANLPRAARQETRKMSENGASDCARFFRGGRRTHPATPHVRPHRAQLVAPQRLDQVVCGAAVQAVCNLHLVIARRHDCAPGGERARQPRGVAPRTLAPSPRARGAGARTDDGDVAQRLVFQHTVDELHAVRRRRLVLLQDEVHRRHRHAAQQRQRVGVAGGVRDAVRGAQHLHDRLARGLIRAQVADDQHVDVARVRRLEQHLRQRREAARQRRRRDRGGRHGGVRLARCRRGLAAGAGSGQPRAAPRRHGAAAAAAVHGAAGLLRAAVRAGWLAGWLAAC